MSILGGSFGGGGVGFASSSHITGGVTGSPGSKVIGGVGAVSQYALIAASRIVSQTMLPAAPTTLNPLDQDPEHRPVADGNLVAKIAHVRRKLSRRKRLAARRHEQLLRGYGP
jgi:hypothetical protein